MIIPLWSGVNNESWREQLRDLDISDEYEMGVLANDLAEYVWDDLMDQGHQPVDAYQQKIGALVLCQNPDAQSIVNKALEKAKERIRLKIEHAKKVNDIWFAAFNSLDSQERERIRKSLQELRLEFQELQRNNTGQETCDNPNCKHCKDT